jgi:hypothetical protein
VKAQADVVVRIHGAQGTRRAGAQSPKSTREKSRNRGGCTGKR